MKSRHTPGPWVPAVYKVTPSMLERLKLGTLQHAVAANTSAEDPQGLLIALCGDEPGLDSESAADARLIAAAPEMLQHLKSIVKARADYHACPLSTNHLAKRELRQQFEAQIEKAAVLLARIEGGGK